MNQKIFTYLFGIILFSEKTMMLITGDETGLVKLVRPSEDEVKTYGEQSRDAAVMGFASINKNQFSLARKNGAVEYWEYVEEDDQPELKQLRSLHLPTVNSVSGVCSLFDTSVQNSGSALVYNADGNVSIVQHNNLDVDQFISTTVKGPIAASASCSHGGVAFGGRENDVFFFDANTQQTIWTAKNVPYDKLRLRVPICITAISFFNPEETTLSSGAKLITGTGYKQIRLYDTRADQRPVKSFEIGEYRVTQLYAQPDETNIFVSDTVGNIFHYDLRNGRRLHALTASDGAVRHMACYEDSETMVCVGLDRHARWHNLNTHKPLKSVYLRNRLNACLPLNTHDSAMKRKGIKRSRNTDSDGEEEDGEEDMEDVDAFFDNEQEESDSNEDDEDVDEEDEDDEEDDVDEDDDDADDDDDEDNSDDNDSN